jgi:hypothetical protein
LPGVHKSVEWKVVPMIIFNWLRRIPFGRECRVSGAEFRRDFGRFVAGEPAGGRLRIGAIRLRRTGAGGDDDVSWGLDPLAFGVDARESANSLDYGRGRYVVVLGLLNDVAEGEAKVAVAGGEKVQGVRVAVNGAAVDVVFVGDGPRA